MTTTPPRTDDSTPAPANWLATGTSTGHWLIPQPDGRWLLGDPDGGIYLAHADLEHLAETLRNAFYGQAPELVRVVGYQSTDGMTQVPLADAPVYEADGVTLTHGLACPWEGCPQIAWDDHYEGITVIDADERWSSFGYRRTLGDERIYDQPTREWRRTGRQQWFETVTGSYADTDYQGLGYRCGACTRPVTLPEGIEEQGD